MVCIDLYYNSKLGYIITSETKVINSIVRTVVESAIIADSFVTKFELSRNIKDALYISENSNPVDFSQVGKYKFWQVENIKSFSAFSKKFRAIKLKKKDNTYEVELMVRKTDGSYASSNPKRELFVLPIETDYNTLAETVIKLFSDEKYEEASFTSFLTLNNNEFSYLVPSDDYEDVGDGGTDAYKIYRKKNSGDYIAFLIDSGYKNLSETDIKNKWEHIYGKMDVFRYRNTMGEEMTHVIIGKTKADMYVSYFFHDGEGILEVIAKIDVRKKDSIEQEENEIRKIINSIRIVSKTYE